MPFRSKAQQGYLFVHHPDVAKEFADKTPKSAYKSLPYHVGKKTNDYSEHQKDCQICSGAHSTSDHFDAAGLAKSQDEAVNRAHLPTKSEVRDYTHGSNNYAEHGGKKTNNWAEHAAPPSPGMSPAFRQHATDPAMTRGTAYKPGRVSALDYASHEMPDRGPTQPHDEMKPMLHSLTQPMAGGNFNRLKAMFAKKKAGSY